VDSSREAGTSRLAAAFSHLPVAVILLDAALDVVEDNGVLGPLLGRPAAPPPDLLMLVHPQDAARLVGTLQGARSSPQGWRDAVRVRLRHADGEWRTLALRVEDELDVPKVGAIVLEAQDVTGQEAAEARVESDQLLRAVVSSTPVVLLILDRAGRVQFAAGAALEVEPEQLVGRTLLDLGASPSLALHLQAALAGEAVGFVADWGGRSWQVRYRPLCEGGTAVGVAGVITDITAQVQAERARSESEANLRAVLEAVEEAIVVVDAELRISWSNAAAARLFGAPLPTGTPVADLLDVDVAEAVGRRLTDPTTPLGRQEVRMRNAAGKPVWLLVTASRLESAAEGAARGTVLVLNDITDHKAAESRLETVALTDALTGLANRVQLADRLGHALTRRAAGVTAVLFFDVDGLKPVNDAYGHSAGDELLRHVARLARTALRPQDTLARYGGDEFVVVAEDLHDVEEAARCAERVRAAISTPLTLSTSVLVPTVSIGVATSPPHRTADELLHAADRAAYAAKHAGGNAVRMDR
jgi:diguanylate cyclase (GGDEF)-like protein/PAS domain S-box-containing protein